MLRNIHMATTMWDSPSSLDIIPVKAKTIIILNSQDTIKNIGWSFSAYISHLSLPKNKSQWEWILLSIIQLKEVKSYSLTLFIISSSQRSLWTALPILSSWIRKTSSIGRHAATLYEKSERKTRFIQRETKDLTKLHLGRPLKLTYHYSQLTSLNFRSTGTNQTAFSR